MKHLLVVLFAGMIGALCAQSISNLPIPIGAGTAEVWNDSIYFFGGSNRWAGTIRYPRIYKFDGSSWSYLDSIPDNNLWDVQSVLAGDDVYLLGGWPSGAHSIRKYNLPSGNWSYLSLSPNSSPYHTTAEYLNGFIYLFGSGNVYEYDIANDSWATKTASPVPGYNLTSLLFQDEIYITGLYDSAFYKYTPATDSWTPLANTPYQIAGCAMGVIGGKIYCVAGSPQGNPGEMQRRVLAYDIATDSWYEDSFQTSGSRILMANVMFRNKFYILGGFDSTAFAIDVVEEITPMGPIIVHAPETGSIPAEFALGQNYPNPFNPETTIEFRIAELGFADLSVFDIAGRLVRTLVKREMIPGNYTYRWDGRNDTGELAASGVYLCRLRIIPPSKVGQESVQTRKVLLVR